VALLGEPLRVGGGDSPVRRSAQRHPVMQTQHSHVGIAQAARAFQDGIAVKIRPADGGV